MDTESGYEITVPYAPNRKFSVLLSEDHNRKPAKSAHLERSINTIWHQSLSENRSLFNASKFRLHHVSTCADNVTLHLGLTDYKTYLATHAAPTPLERFGAECMALPLGNVVIPITRDEHTFVLVRSGNAAEGKFKCVFPGGHAEPDEISNVGTANCAQVRRELADSAKRELMEELFVEEEMVERVEDMCFLGIVRRRSDWKSSMIFSARLFCDTAFVEQRYRERNRQEEESVRLFKVRLDELVSEGIYAVVPKGYEPMPELVGAADLYVQKCALSLKCQDKASDVWFDPSGL
ncbi:Nudix hydrolase 9 [Gracilariopsis chorda]|uniref:Nudix hydrolase 9 n=1 Tax=Gracilariopsis chorda TaxID=448386 RepID=A0A2V3IWZ4_9FLOR|nr:Nudix hydrolase 9 [Gracilariopsis chorda]|eukprot:PXF45660.1 Nudix hydrolase 9 [Gracilariopsis chorda]